MNSNALELLPGEFEQGHRAAEQSKAVLTLTDLSVGLPGSAENAGTLVSKVSLEVPRGKTVGIVGESGSGKTLTAMAAADLLPPPLVVLSGAVCLSDGVDSQSLSSKQRRAAVNRRVGVIFQNPTASLNPRLRIGAQMREVLRQQPRAQRSQWRNVASELLIQVGINDTQRILRSYPHELSGGLNQRVAIALALSRDPEVLIADEPTTALDVTVQATILDLLDSLAEQRHLGVLLISHDLNVIAGRTETVHVMAAGRVIESGPTSQVLSTPATSHTRSLLDARPSRLASPNAPASGLLSTTVSPVVQATEVRKVFPSSGGGGLRGKPEPHVALDGVSVTLHTGQALGLVGESGSGKTTFARIMAGLETPDSGSIRFGESLTIGTTKQHRGAHPTGGKVQYIFQNATAALDPHLTIEESIREPLELNLAVKDRKEISRRISSVAEEVELTREQLSRRPHQLSGGQCQRAVIARALVNEPQLLIADEPVSALDLSVQATILQLFARLRADRGLTYLFISHDLSVVSYLCEQIAVMHRGKIVESGPTGQVLANPQEPYTKMLIASIPAEL